MDKDYHDQLPPIADSSTAKSFALSGKIMLSAIIVLFFVVVLMLILHVYAKWYLLRARRRQLLQRRNRNNARRPHIVFYVDNDPTSLALHEPANNGLEPAVIGSLPIFVYNPKTHPKEMDCAVCLSEFEENEKGRLLPKCNHSFHVECIDMWFHSHSTCPICRASVEPVPTAPEGMKIEAGSSSSSMWSRRKGLDLTGVRIEIPNSNELETELSLSSPASHGFRSPVTQLLSLKRILSMGRKTPSTSNTPTTSCGVGTSCSSGVTTELDLESGSSELTQTRLRTPR